MSMIKNILSLLLVGALAATASADLVATYTFDFEGTAGADLISVGSTTVSGPLGDLTLTANAVGGSFFVGSAGLGIGNTVFDSGGTEAMQFSFSLTPPPTTETFNFSVMTLGSFGGTQGTDTARLTVDGDEYLFTKSAIGSDTVPVNVSFDLSDDFEFRSEVGTVALRNFVIQIASVPEPTAFLFGSLVAGCVGTVVARRRKREA
ncbi:hypothetical protein Pla123a_17990 [Posidoniimonas polymericola]|uniref:PEP-CTERM protein-sorting domain-containing protein n=1 Tax=Posidoniimonas polymericola TaxID=2528002 RepID=A0A5C5YT97_9BACT|nr:hypothetical protein [Posidoniimonas polymericola]TWT78000.1 hypothetical protein Pla123a_17990 [Posidoniimonas polymericola]